MDEENNESKRMKTELNEMRSKIDNIQSDVTEIKGELCEMNTTLQSALLILKSMVDHLTSTDSSRFVNSFNNLTGIQSLNSINEMNSINCLNGINCLNSTNGDHSLKSNLGKVKLAPIYNGSSTMVDERALEHAMNAANKAKNSKHCIFISKIFTSVCGVRDVYRRSRSGTAPRIKTENCVEKKRFCRHLHDELVDAAKFHFGHINKDESDRIKKTITDKLQSLNSYLLKLKESPNEIPKNIASKVTSEDMAYFKDLELFRNDPKLFDELDREFSDYVGNQSNAVNCILDWIKST